MIPLRSAVLVGIGVAALLLAGVAGWNINGARWSDRYSQMQADYDKVSAQVLKDALEEQQRRLTATQEISDEGDEAIEVVHVAAAGADESVRLRNEELTGLLARTRRDLSNAATQRQADRQTIMVLTELYRGADDRAGELAVEFEGARARGLTCEAMYAAMCPKQ